MIAGIILVYSMIKLLQNRKNVIMIVGRIKPITIWQSMKNLDLAEKTIKEII